MFYLVSLLYFVWAIIVQLIHPTTKLYYNDSREIIYLFFLNPYNGQ